MITKSKIIPINDKRSLIVSLSERDCGAMVLMKVWQHADDNPNRREVPNLRFDPKVLPQVIKYLGDLHQACQEAEVSAGSDGAA